MRLRLRNPEAPQRHAAWWVWSALAATVAGSLIVRVVSLGDTPLSLEEAFAAWAADQPLTEMWRLGAPADTVSPVFSTLLAVWSVLGDSAAVLRLFSALVGTGTVFVVFLAGRAVAGNGVGLGAALLLALAPFHVTMSQTVGPFALMGLGVAASLWGLALTLRQRRAGPPLYVIGTLVVVLGAGSGLYYLVAVNAGFAFWWWYRHRRAALRPWLRLQAIVVAAGALWLPALAQNALGAEFGRGIDTSSVSRVGVAVHNIYAGHTLFVSSAVRPLVALAVAALLAAIIVTGLWRRRPDRDWLGAVLIIAALPVVMIIAVAVWQPVLETEAVSWAVVPLLLAVAAGLGALPRMWLTGIGVAALAAVGVFGMWRYATENDPEEWDRAADYMAARVAADDLVLYSADAARLPIAHYLDGEPPGTPGPDRGFDGGLGPETGLGELEPLRDLIAGHSKVWIVLSQNRLTDPLGLLTFELERSGAVVDQQRFGGVRLAAYDIGAQIDFTRVSFPIANPPTAMTFGPDGRLYVAEILGTIHAYTLDDNLAVVEDEVIETVTTAHGGPRLTLGIAVDPDSTPDDVTLWVAHSFGEIFIGEVNTGVISRLSGPRFGEIEDVITGLPRSLANHATNSIHFGPDGRLYIAQGGNTATGAANLGQSEFRDMAEQPLSAALLVADVKAPGFNGDCGNDSDIFGPATCDVVPFATGLRNMYDFLFHSNGHLYGPDNGLGVVGAIPPRATAPCTELGDPAPLEAGGGNPGVQPDLLFDIVDGGYYGHPNPYRDECVFKDGSAQGVAAPANYVPPLAVLGDHRSANGIVQYTNEAFCAELVNDLLITNFVSGDVSRIELSADGASVEDIGSVLTGFSSPLPIVTRPDGTILIGEYNTDPPQITVLRPLSGCWKAGHEPLPTPLVDAHGTALDGKLYVVAGKNTAGPRNSLFIYDPVADTWTTGADLPGPAVEDPAVAALDGRLYVFGGAPLPFSGAVSNAAVYDPSTDAWRELPPLPAPRAGAAAVALNGEIYIAGGMDSGGVSLSSVTIFNPADDSYGVAPDMGTRRDNPGAVAFGDRMYVFGGRTRNADGTAVGELATTEMFDPAAGAWVERAPLPTGRRRMVAAALEGTIVVIGGEQPPGGGAFDVTEQYDPESDTWRALAPVPTPRHGAVGGTIDGVLYVVAGSPGRGIFALDTVESFTLGPR